MYKFQFLQLPRSLFVYKLEIKVLYFILHEEIQEFLVKIKKLFPRGTGRFIPSKDIIPVD